MISISINISAIRKDNRIICCDKDFNILKIYNESKNVTEDGFCCTTLCNILSSPNKFYRGYYWYKLSEFSLNHRNKLEEYYDKYQQGSIEPKILPKDSINVSKKVVNCDENGNIFGIYESIHKADKETGISYKSISNVINSKTNKHRATGTYWYKLTDYIIKYPNKNL